MENSTTQTTAVPVPRLSLLKRSLAIMKPITWFAPLWAFLCGAVASGAAGLNLPDIAFLVMGMLMAGPVLTGFSQVINDYFDKDIDAINEPQRLIPSGQVSTLQVVVTAVVLLAVGVLLGLVLGTTVLTLVGIGLLLAVLYSAPPFRAKRNGWVGNLLVGVAYEGLAWLAGHAAFAEITTGSLIVAALYSLGTHGIMSINDYKSIDGDRATGIRTIPVQLGPVRAAWSIVITMVLAQVGVVATLLVQGNWIAALVVVGIMLLQVPLYRDFIGDPTGKYIKFSAIGVSVFVWGMMAAAIGLRTLG